MQFSASRWHRANAWLANHWFAFLFLLFHRMLCHPTLDDLYSLWSCMDQWLLQPSKQQKLRAPDSAVIITALVLKSPFFWRRLSSVSSLSADAGAEQWYKTIAKLMQGRNRNSTHTNCEYPKWFPLSVVSTSRLVATWLILPVVICLS